MNSVMLDLGFIKIYWYSFFILMGVIVGYKLAINESQKFKIPKDYMINYFFYVLIFGLLGARAYYVIFNFAEYQNNLLDIFKVWEGGLAIHGGIIAGILVTLVYTKKYKIPFFRIADIMVISLIIGQCIGRWGNFFNGEAHGPVTTLSFLQSLHLPKFIIDGMYINGTYYQPTLLYETIGCWIGFIILILIRKRKNLILGDLTSIYLIWYGIIRFFIEGLRTDSLLFFNLKAAQLVSIIMIICGILIIVLTRCITKYRKYYHKINHGKIFF